ncbi:NfeD family protein [Peribacillus glennii]|nr:nodulation protein NfeD [Peribacillus glennii]
MRLWHSAFVLILTMFAFALFPQYSSAKSETVYIVPVEDTVENGLYAFLKRALKTAESNKADLVILDINTPGGAVDAAGKIGKLISETPIRTAAFVNNRALSAGAYISLNADEIYMVPNATMGSAAVIDSSGNMAEKKAQSYWVAAMETAAEQNGRDPRYARAMAQEGVNLPEFEAKKGSLLTLTAAEAERAGYSEGTVAGRAVLLKEFGLEDADIRHVNETFSEKLARLLTSPFVVPLLLTIAAVGLVIEVFSPGFGIPGLAGITALILFFYGHLVAGLAGYETVALFVIGMFLIVLEFFLPGGITGVLGLVAVIASLFMASGNVVNMALSIFIALTASILVSILFVKVFRRKMNFFKKIILTDSTNTEKGYVSNQNRLELMGKQGRALTDLRPSGTALIDEERVDVVTEGSFITKGSLVRVIKAEGSRIVVREVNE